MSASTESPNTTQNYGDEKGRSEPMPDNDAYSDDRRGSKAMRKKSQGVARVEAISSVLTTKDRIFLFLSVFLISYAYGLDGTLRYVYQPTATADLRVHSLQATVNVLRAVIAAAAQPTAAKIADVFGRAELVLVSVFFYVIGTIIEAAATNIDTFSAGACIYQIGYTSIIVLVEVIIADVTSSRARLLFSYIPATPFLINTWASGSIASDVLAATTWRWGIGMWSVIYTVCAAPLVITLTIVGRRARRQGVLDTYKSDFQAKGAASLTVQLFWQLDVIGVLLMIATFALILTPLTLAGGFSAEWRQAHIIAPLVVGFVSLALFLIWELYFAPHPIVPMRRMTDRGIWGPMGIALFLNFCWGMQADYLYTVLIVAFDFSIAGATRITNLYSFTSVITGTLLGLIVYKVKRLKPFIIAGVLLFMVALGLMIHYRGGDDNSNQAGVIGAQVLLGFAGGMFPYPAQASLQIQVKHEYVAVMTGLYLATYNVGSAFGYTVSGAMWTQILPGELERNLAFQSNETLASAAYADPFSIALLYPIGTPERTAMVDAYQHIQRLLCITGICLCVPLLAFAFAVRNPKLDKRQNVVEDSDSETNANLQAGQEIVAHGQGKWYRKVFA